MKYADMIIETFTTPDMPQTGAFKVRVISSPAGDMKFEEAAQVPYNDKQWQDSIQQLDERALNPADLKKFGRDLADFLLPPTKQANATTSVRELYSRSLTLLDQDTGLRLRLRLDKRLAFMPWEYMYIEPDGGDGIDGFLALNQRVAIIRYEELSSPPPLTVTKGNVKLVAAFAQMANNPVKLDLGQEEKNLKDALSGQPSLLVDYLENAKSSDVQSHITGAGVFHFAGHGTFDMQLGEEPGTIIGTGSIFLEDGPIGTEQLGILLNNSSVRLVVLGACETGRRDGINPWSGIAPELVKVNVPAVVANQFSIQDNCAIAFNQQFYQAALVGGLSIEESVGVGRRAAYQADPNGRDWGVAVLYLRANDGLLFGGAADDTLRQKAINNASSWDALLSSAKQNAARFQGSSKRASAPFIPDLYVHRTDEENILNDFLNTDTPALVLVGNSGIGKTNLLGAWQQSLQAAGHIAFYYDCSNFPKAEVEAEVSRDLSPGLPDDLSAALERINTLATNKAKQCVLLFDAIGEFRNGNAGPDVLIKNLTAFAQHSPVRIRVVLGCRTSTWNRLDFDITKSLAAISFQPTHADEDAALRLDLFTEQMVKEAYDRYAQFFSLRTPYTYLPDDLFDRLRYPMMLRMLAAAYQGEVVNYQHEALSLYQRFYDERTKGRPHDSDLATALAAEMLRQQHSLLSVKDLSHNDALKNYMNDTSPDSSYNRLQDNGILTVVPGNRLRGDMVKFTSDQLGGYVLALGMDDANADKIASLMQSIQQFSLAWYTAQAILVLGQDAKIFTDLAQHLNVEVHELLVESLVELYADQSDTAMTVIKQLLQEESKEAQCIGLKASYFVKPPARDIFLWAAAQQSPPLRRLTRNMLYLIWRSDHNFTYDLLSTLTNRASIMAPQVVQFIFDLLVTVYINNCELDYVINDTNDIFYKLTTDKLPLRLITKMLSVKPMGIDLEGFFVSIVDRFFTQQLVKAVDQLVGSQAFFDLPVQEKARLKKVAPFLDPQTDVTTIKDELDGMLRSDLTIFNYIAALVFSIHACRNFPSLKPFMQSLFDAQQGRGRLWLLLSLCVLLQETPPEWKELAEEFTHRLIEEHPAIFYGDEPSFLTTCDVVFLPLGLAYGKVGTSMPYIEKLLSDGMQQNNKKLVERCIKALGTVGFYYPQAVLQTLNAAIPNITSADVNTALVSCLSTMRVLSFNEVDRFLRHIGADEELQRLVSASTDMDAVDRAIQLLGLHNNSVHFSINYPRMRDVLSIGALTMLADAASPHDFTTQYTLAAIHLTEKYGFQLKEWTLQ